MRLHAFICMQTCVIALIAIVNLYLISAVYSFVCICWIRALIHLPFRLPKPMMVVLLLLDCKKRLENLKFIHHASTFALKAVSSTTDKNKPQNQQFRQFW